MNRRGYVHGPSSMARRGGQSPAFGARCSVALALALLVALAAGEAAGQSGGLFREVPPAAAGAAAGFSTVSDSIALRRRLVAIDFGQLTPPTDPAAFPGGAEAAPSGVLTLNLFDDASFTGLVQSVAPTFSGGYSLSGPLTGVEMGTMTLVVNGDVVAGTVRTLEATYRIRPAGAGLHAVSQVDPSRLPPLGEPIPGRGWEEERPPFGPDGGLPAPVEPRLAPPGPAAFRATEDTPSADAQASIATDRATLEALYDATDGANWTDSTNWKTSAPLGEWFGVTTDTSGRVTGLSLSSNGLAGPLLASMGNLAELRWLDLRWNRLTGSIPASLGNLVKLQRLDLGDNQLTGQIPASLGNLVDLQWLLLLSNELTGGIPAELGNLNLSLLGLSRNDLSVGGPIPAWLRNHTNLQWLFLGDSGVTGEMPAWLRELGNLLWLDLGGNELTGRIPAFLGDLTNLQYLQFDANDLTGPIPSMLGNLTNLRYLELDRNDLTGSIPSELGRLTNLARLRLSGNDLTGPIPSELGNLTNLEWLTLSYNWGLTAPLPQGLRSSPLERLVYRTRFLGHKFGLRGLA